MCARCARSATPCSVMVVQYNGGVGSNRKCRRCSNSGFLFSAFLPELNCQRWDWDYASVLYFTSTLICLLCLHRNTWTISLCHHWVESLGSLHLTTAPYSPFAPVTVRRRRRLASIRCLMPLVNYPFCGFHPQIWASFIGTNKHILVVLKCYPALCLLAAVLHNKPHTWVQRAPLRRTPYVCGAGEAAAELGRWRWAKEAAVSLCGWQRDTGALTEFAFAGTTVLPADWQSTWCHGLRERCQILCSYFLVKEVHVVQPDKLDYCIASKLSELDIDLGTYIHVGCHHSVPPPQTFIDTQKYCKSHVLTASCFVC